MIVKFFNHGSSPIGCLEYMLKEDREVKPVVLSGSPDLTQELMNRSHSRFSKCYTAGVLSFEEADINAKDKLAIMSDFEDALMCGVDRDDYNVLWVEHRDKGRLELNFIIPRIHLSTERHLQPFYAPVDMRRIDAFKDCINLEYGFSNPKDLSKKQSFIVPRELPRSRKEVINFINGHMDKMINEGEISNRADIIEYLNSLDGVGVVRTTLQALSIRVEGHDRNIRLRGGVYEQSFTATVRRTREEDKRTAGSVQSGDREQLSERRKVFERLYSRKYQENEQKYRRYKRAIRNEASTVYEEANKENVAQIDNIRDDCNYSKLDSDIRADLLSKHSPDKEHQSEYSRHIQQDREKLRLERGELSSHSQRDHKAERGRISHDRKSTDRASDQRMGVGASRFNQALRGAERHNRGAKEEAKYSRGMLDKITEYSRRAKRIIEALKKIIKQKIAKRKEKKKDQSRGFSM